MRINPGFVAGITTHHGETRINKMSETEMFGNQNVGNDKIAHAPDGRRNGQKIMFEYRVNVNQRCIDCLSIGPSRQNIRTRLRDDERPFADIPTLMPQKQSGRNHT